MNGFQNQLAFVHGEHAQRGDNVGYVAPRGDEIHLPVKVRLSCLVRQMIARRVVGISTALPAPPGRRTLGLW